MASLESGVGYFLLDTEGTGNVPRASKLRQKNVLHTYTKHDPHLQGMLQTVLQVDSRTGNALPRWIHVFPAMPPRSNFAAFHPDR